MRLVNTSTTRLETFLGELPHYAILSHTWGDEEILFEDINGQSSFPVHKKGWPKFQGSCEKARHDGYKYIWIDTCCIDKSSSAELSEAINSMFWWYQMSCVCYVYLVDICFTTGTPSTSAIVRSRWFERGWTLQELIAPRNVIFFDIAWHELGRKVDAGILKAVAEYTRIPEDILTTGNNGPCPIARDNSECGNRELGHRHDFPGRDSLCPRCLRRDILSQLLDQYSVFQKMNWAEKRQTTRVEDEAYSLLGLFNVNLPLLYGEGSKAFFRLQEEIMKSSADQSILAKTSGRGLLATSTKNFAPFRERRPSSSSEATELIFVKVSRPGFQFALSADNYRRYHLRLTPGGIETGIYICPLHLNGDADVPPEHTGLSLGILNCGSKDDNYRRPALLLRKLDLAAESFLHTGIVTTIFPGQARGILNAELSIIALSPTLSASYDLSESYFQRVLLVARLPLGRLEYQPFGHPTVLRLNQAYSISDDFQETYDVYHHPLGERTCYFLPESSIVFAYNGSSVLGKLVVQESSHDLLLCLIWGLHPGKASTDPMAPWALIIEGTIATKYRARFSALTTPAGSSRALQLGSEFYGNAHSPKSYFKYGDGLLVQLEARIVDLVGDTHCELTLSSIDPSQVDPAELRRDDGVRVEFRNMMEEHPKIRSSP